MTRLYEPIWKELKKKQKVQLEVHPSNLTKVKKMVQKEKLYDAAFKIMNDNDGDSFFLRFHYDPEKKVLTIRLKQVIGISEVIQT